jgi:Protein of unknown function, DUF488
MSSLMMSTIFTIGHSNRSIPQFLNLLQQVAVDLLVDVRSIPRSRRNPQFNAEVLPEALGVARIAYRHLPALGGLRHRAKGAMPSLNTFWQVAAFRNYADYAATEEFRTAPGGKVDHVSMYYNPGPSWRTRTSLPHCVMVCVERTRAIGREISSTMLDATRL